MLIPDSRRRKKKTEAEEKKDEGGEHKTEPPPPPSPFCRFCSSSNIISCLFPVLSPALRFLNDFFLMKQYFFFKEHLPVFRIIGMRGKDVKAQGSVSQSSCACPVACHMSYLSLPINLAPRGRGQCWKRERERERERERG